MTIVVGYLTSPEGKAALEAAIREARERDARLVVVLSASDDVSGTVDAQVDAVRDRLDDAQVAYEVRRMGRSKDVVADILATATDVAAELIVIGLRRRTAVGKLFLGSTAQQILLDASCAVLGVKARAEDTPSSGR